MKFSDFETDTSAEEDGKWFVFGGDGKVKMRALHSQKVRDTQRRLHKPFDAIVASGGEISDEDAEKLAKELFAQAVIVDWSGFDKDYSLETCRNALDMRKFRDRCAQLVTNDKAYDVEREEEAVKN